MALKPLGLQRMNLDFGQRVIDTYNVNNADVKTRGLEVHVLSSGLAYDCTGVTLKLYVRTKDLNVYESISATVGGATGVFEVLFPEGISSGLATGEIMLSNTTEAIGSFQFPVNVINSLTSDVTISQAPGAGILLDVIQNEPLRVEAEQAREDTFDELVETGIIQTNINAKLNELETAYAPRLTTAESNIANIPNQIYITEKAKTVDVNSVLALKAENTDLQSTDLIAKDAQTKANNPLGQMADNIIPSSKLKQTTDADKIKLANLSLEVRDAIAGTTTIGTTPAAGSVTATQLANGAATFAKQGLLGKTGFLIGNAAPNFDFVNKKFILDTTASNYYVAFGSTVVMIVSTGVTYQLDITVSPTYSYGCIVLNKLTNTLAVKNSIGELIETDLLVAMFRVDKKIAWMIGDYLINGESADTKIASINSAIVDINSAIGTGYKDADYAELLAYISEVTRVVNKGFSFSLITDLHNDTTKITWHKICLYRELMKQGITDCNIICGDLINEQLAKASGREFIRQVTEQFNNGYNGNPSLIIKGNHDCTNYYNTEKENILTDTEWYNLALRNITSKAIFPSENPYANYYYMDFDKYKIRVIILDTFNQADLIDTTTGELIRTLAADGVTELPIMIRDVPFINQAQINWVCNEALDLNDRTGWGVIIASHSGFAGGDEYIYSNDAIQAVIQSFKNKTAVTSSTFSHTFAQSNALYDYASRFNLTVTTDFTDVDASNEIICCVNGHGHYDGYTVVNGITYIAEIGTSTFYPPIIPDWASTPTRNENDVTAHGFDTVFIDRDNRKIICKRFGAGSDKEINY